MFRVIEVAKILGVSKVTIYKKMDRLKKELKPHIHKRSNITYIDEDGLSILKTHIEKNNYNVGDHVDLLDIKQQSNDDLSNILDLLSSQIVVKKQHYDSNEKIIDNLKFISKNNEMRIRVLEEKLKLRS